MVPSVVSGNPGYIHDFNVVQFFAKRKRAVVAVEGDRRGVPQSIMLQPLASIAHTFAPLEHTACDSWNANFCRAVIAVTDFLQYCERECLAGLVHRPDESEVGLDTRPVGIPNTPEQPCSPDVATLAAMIPPQHFFPTVSGPLFPTWACWSFFLRWGILERHKLCLVACVPTHAMRWESSIYRALEHHVNALMIFVCVSAAPRWMRRREALVCVAEAARAIAVHAARRAALLLRQHRRCAHRAAGLGKRRSGDACVILGGLGSEDEEGEDGQAEVGDYFWASHRSHRLFIPLCGL